MKKAEKITIKGSVQGIFFRNYIKENAETLNLKGFVRNLDTGDVELFVEGDIENVDKMHEVCRQGTKQATIKEVEIREVEFQDFPDFKVLHI